VDRVKEKIAGINGIAEALKGKRKIYNIYVQEGQQNRRLEKLLAEAGRKGVFVQTVPKAKLDQMYKESNHQGIVAQVESFSYASVEDLLELAYERKEHPFILILDGIEDPQNFGSIIRTAEAAGVHGIVIPRHNSCPVTETVMKVSAGACEHIKIAQETNLSQTMDYLKKQGLWLIGTDSQSKQTYFEADWPEAIAIVIGNEGRGIRTLVKKNCDISVNIPMRGKVTSLNASVAASLMIYEALRQRRLRE
jgi:23S rRNA (guanosine2251-2'-O)-methyltransferase